MSDKTKQAELKGAGDSLQAYLMTLLITADAPMSQQVLKEQLAKVTNQPFDLAGLLVNLTQVITPLGLLVKRNDAGVRLVLAESQQAWLTSLYPQRQPRLSRAAIEILAILIIEQPVTRAEIEAIRGVQVSSSLLHHLKDLGWVSQEGQKQVPGLPFLWVTTDKLVQDLGLASNEALKNELMSRIASFKAEIDADLTENAKIQPH